MIFLAVYLRTFDEVSVKNAADVFARCGATCTLSTDLHDGKKGLLGVALLGNRLKGERLIQSSNGQSILFGTMFTADPSSDTDVLSPDFVAEALRTRCESVAQAYWGNYAGIFTDSATGELHVCRDAVGGMPLYVFDDPTGSVVISNDFRTLVSAAVAGPRLDRQALLLAVRFCGLMPSRRTGILGVEELLPGECVSWTLAESAPSRRICWWPSVVAADAIPLTEDVLAALAERFESCVAQWCETTERPALYFSGGLDSSSILSAIRRIRPDLDPYCLHYFRKGGVTDECYYAELVGRWTGTDVEFLDCGDLNLSLEYDPIYDGTSRPFDKILYAEFDRSVIQKTTVRKCDSLWMGLGGDNLFIDGPDAKLAVDAFLQDGISAMVRTIRNVALHKELPFLWVMADSLRYFVPRSRALPWASDMLNKCVAAGNPASSNAALIDVADTVVDVFGNIACPGQRQRLMNVYYEVCTSAEMRKCVQSPGVSVIYPYLSQPFLAEILSVRAFDMIEGEVNRLAQRKMGVGHLPPEILRRLDKGGSDDPVYRFIINHAEEVDRFLSTGHLAAAEIIDPSKLRINTNEFIVNNGAMNIASISCVLSAEVWVRGMGLSSTDID